MLFGALISFSLFAVSIVLFVFMRDRNLSQASIASCSIELITLAYSVALFITVFFDNELVTEETRWLFIMMFLVTALLFCDIVSWVINDRAEYLLANVIMYDATYIMGTFLSLSVWKLIRVALSLKEKKYQFIDRFILALFIVNVLLVLTNPITGLIYRQVDGALEYSKSEAIYTVQDSLILLIDFIIVLRSPKRGEEKVAAIVLAVSPLVGILVTRLTNEFECMYPFYFISVLFSFVCIYSGRTQELETKEKDLKFAAAIQQGLIPHIPVTGKSAAYEICGSALEAGEIGGDFYDYFMMDDEHLAFLAGDVCGEGVPAALCMMQTISTAHDFITAGFRGREVFDLTNKRLCEHNKMGFFVSCWFAMLNIRTGSLQFSNAGHRPPLLLHPDGSWELLKTSPDAPLASLPETEYSEFHISLNKGDTIILCTDGVYTSFLKTGETDPSGIIVELAHENIDRFDFLCSSIINRADEKVPEGPEKEDMTVLAVRFNGTEKEVEQL